MSKSPLTKVITFSGYGHADEALERRQDQLDQVHLALGVLAGLVDQQQLDFAAAERQLVVAVELAADRLLADLGEARPVVLRDEAEAALDEQLLSRG